MDKNNPVQVLIVDDSALMRKYLASLLGNATDVQVADRAFNGAFALKKIAKQDFDVITLDLVMPEMDGIEFLKRRKEARIAIPVVVISSLAQRGAQITMEALALGAADFVHKPAAAQDNAALFGQELLKLIRIYGRRYQLFKVPPDNIKRIPAAYDETGQANGPPKAVLHPAAPPTPLHPHGPVEIIAIGISTGGPNALRIILSKIHPQLRIPILVVQHMPAGFTTEFAKSLDQICPLEVKEAQDKDLIKPGRVLIAPGNRHMLVENLPLSRVIRLSNDPPLNSHRPSVDVLFASVVKTYKNNCMAIIMTGMGKDGAAEIGSIFREGGITLAQNKDSCVVFGMPRIAIERGFIHKICDLEGIAEQINMLTRSPHDLAY